MTTLGARLALFACLCALTAACDSKPTTAPPAATTSAGTGPGGAGGPGGAAPKSLWPIYRSDRVGGPRLRVRPAPTARPDFPSSPRPPAADPTGYAGSGRSVSPRTDAR